MGEEHYTGGAPRLPAFLVVVRVGLVGGVEGDWVGMPRETIVPHPPAAHSVFWDLYCAAPDRREACEHSNEAKAFQDYVSPCPMDLDQGSWAWASFRAWGLGGLHGLRLAGVGRWVWCWGLIWDVGHFRGFPMPSV